jgi:O-antigen biosynthesis protein
MRAARGLRRMVGSAPASKAIGMPLAMSELARRGPAPLAAGGPIDASAMSIAAVIPSFKRGSGGHATIARLLEALRALGHEVSVWLEDSEGWHTSRSPEQLSADFREFFDAGELSLAAGFDRWQGADMVLATGWQTVARVLMLPGAGARAYLVQDHEPDFYAASAESLWAQWTYRQGLHAIAASPWLAKLLQERYECSSTSFDLALDHAVYRPGPDERREDLVVFYARASTPRRAVPLGLAALGELAERHPDLTIGLFGQGSPLETGFRHRDLGILDGASLARLYSDATVGMVLSVTNPSLICLEMMACGLPCVELASDSMVASFGLDGPLRLEPADPVALCRGTGELLADRRLREEVSARGVALAGTRTWHGAAQQVEEGLRAAVAYALS